MRRISCLPALVSIVVCLCPFSRAAGENLIPNPGMEADADKDGRPDGWAVDGKILEKVGWLVAMKGSVRRESDKAKEGKFSLAYSSSKPGEKGVPDDKLFSYRTWESYYRPGKIDTFTPIACNKIKVEPGKTYRLSAWTAAKDIPYLMIHLIRYYEEGIGPGLGALLKPPGVEGISKSGTWEWLEWTCPQRVTHMGFIPIIAENGPDRWVWIDRTSMEQTAAPETNEK